MTIGFRRPQNALRALGLAGASALAALALAALPMSGASAQPARLAAAVSATGAGPCGTAAHGDRQGAHYKHVIWIWMENQSYGSIIGSSNAPYINQLAAECGLATNYHNIDHPSAPNYLAATTGLDNNGAGDCTPSQCPDNDNNLYAQLDRAHKSWRVYEEGMPSNCAQGPLDSGWEPPYDVNHNPAVYFPSLLSECSQWDQPMGTPTSGNFATKLATGLPDFTFIAPGVCNDMHSCAVSVGDAYLQQLMTAITGSKDYRDGSTAVFLVWDEGENGSTNNCAFNTTDVGCHVAAMVVSPTTRPGTQSGELFNHYSLLKTTEQLLDLHGYLGNAASPLVHSMIRAFGLGAARS
jgi:phosphatidylinositol-3-phosphatase